MRKLMPETRILVFRFLEGILRYIALPCVSFVLIGPEEKPMRDKLSSEKIATK